MNVRRTCTAAACSALTLAAALFACTTTSSGGAPARGNAGETVESWGAALAAGDVNGLVSLCSEDFEHPEWGDREGLRAFFMDAKAKDFFEGGAMSPEYIRLRNHVGAAVAYPVEYESSWGPVVFELTLHPERDAWKIFRLRMEQF